MQRLVDRCTMSEVKVNCSLVQPRVALGGPFILYVWWADWPEGGQADGFVSQGQLPQRIQMGGRGVVRGDP